MEKSFIKKVRLQDRIATRVITVGGMVVIASVIGILALILKVALPLFLPAKAVMITSRPLPVRDAATIRSVGIDDYREVGFVVDHQGRFSFFKIADGGLVSTQPTAGDPARRIKSIELYKNSIYNILWDNDSLTVAQVSFGLEFDEHGQRSVRPRLAILETLAPGRFEAPAVSAITRRSEEGRLTNVALLPGNRLAVRHKATVTDIFDNEQTDFFSFTIDEELPGTITAFTLNEQGTVLYAGTDTGNLVRWDLSENDSYLRTDNVMAVPGERAVVSLAMVFGDSSLAVGDDAGGLSTWSRVRTISPAATKKLRKIHSLTPHASPVIGIVPSRRNKSLVSLDRTGIVHFDHMTSENHLLTIEEPLRLFALADRGNSLIGLDRKNTVRVWEIDSRHPEINLRTLLGTVWYENYDQPEYVWQSSSGSDDFEPKFSIVPLLFGTIKGTLYAMIFAVPLAVFGAVYTSRFTTGYLKRTIKPAIEIMASVPSVVIGFLIALWLAPIVEKHILGVLLSLLLLPLFFVLSMPLLKPLAGSERLSARVKGYEFLVLTPLIFITATVGKYLGPVVEALLFDGNFTLWLFNDLGVRYDQRNCIIIAFGLGIAVIPIIFSITEDAISNIPPSLTAASLALGASRWQTVWRVVLPSASPGIFAAIMIGFGRAVGETMIVLMATGNTPILDWSIFNGMRTLSANIAVEIPEAPVGGTLYRVLFLCATLLFSLTFILNTGAEIIREHLRKKYGRY